MVDWHNPAIVAAEEFALVKFSNVIGGIYIWEFISCLDFEYSVITKKRKFTWSFLLYLGCRLCPLFTVVSQFLGFNESHQSVCQAWVVMSFTFGYLSAMFASALIILRVAVLWDRNKIVMAFACTVWLGNAAVYSYSTATLHSASIGSSCIILDTAHARFNVLSTFATDIILLVLMLTGLVRWKAAPKGWGIWRLLCMQGLTWVAIVTLAEVPASVFLLLNLNDPLNLSFQLLALIVSTLGATRLYRGLVDFPTTNSSTAKVASSDPGRVSRASHQPPSRQEAVGGLVVLDNLQVTMSVSEVPQTAKAFEGGNIV